MVRQDLRGVQGWRGGEADLHRVKVVEHATVPGDVVVEAGNSVPCRTTRGRAGSHDDIRRPRCSRIDPP